MRELQKSKVIGEVIHVQKMLFSEEGGSVDFRIRSNVGRLEEFSSKNIFKVATTTNTFHNLQHFNFD